MRCLALDDEPLALNIVRDFCKRVDFIESVELCSNPFEALTILNQSDIDLVFVDIQMPNLSGMEFARSIEKPPLIIFTTAYSKYALDGFELSAVDYLVKPFAFERFLRAVNKAYELSTLRRSKTGLIGEPDKSKEAVIDYLMVKVEYRMVRISLEEILFIEGLKDYVKIYISDKFIMTKSTMRNIEEKLPQAKFIRVHKSFIIALGKIESIENNRIQINKRLIPVGNQYKAEFYKRLEDIKL